MKIVWTRHPSTVRTVQEQLRERRSLAYTTVMTIMHRLYLKGFLQRTLKGKTHLYQPAVAFSEVRDAAVAGVVSQYFEGSRDDLARFLGDDFDNFRPERTNPPVNSLDESLL